MVRGTPPDGAHRWLHAKPLDAAIGHVLVPYWPGGRHGHRRRHRDQNTNKTQLLASDYRTFLLAKPYMFVTRKGPSTHVINGTSFITM
jgi:hypothetical protein